MDWKDKLYAARTATTNLVRRGAKVLGLSGGVRQVSAWIPSCERLELKWPEPSFKSGGELMLLRDLVFMVEVSDTNESFKCVVQEGFMTDLASDPLDRRGRWDYASVVHDWIYWNKGELFEGVNLTRKEADKVFLDIMNQCAPIGFSSYWYYTKNYVDYLAVRAFGQKEWEDDD